MAFDSALRRSPALAARALAEQRRRTASPCRAHGSTATRRGSDYSGKDVHVAARIAALARGGEILASAATAALAGSYPTTESRVVSLKGVSGDVEVVSIAWK